MKCAGSSIVRLAITTELERVELWKKARALNSDQAWLRSNIWNLEGESIQKELDYAKHLETKDLKEDEERAESLIDYLRHGAALAYLRSGETAKAEPILAALRADARDVDSLNELCWTKAVAWPSRPSSPIGRTVTLPPP